MKINRLLAMVILLINRKKLTGRQLADHFEVTIKTIRRDIDSLTLAGIPIYAEVGQNGGYYIHENFTLNRQLFTEKEYTLLMDLAVGLKTVLAVNYPLLSSPKYVIQTSISVAAIIASLWI